MWHIKNPVQTPASQLQPKDLDTCRALEVKIVLNPNDAERTMVSVYYVEGYTENEKFKAIRHHPDNLVAGPILLGEMLRNFMVNDPPENPANGFTCVVGSNPTGAFVGQSDNMAQWNDGQWSFALVPCLFNLVKSSVWSLLRAKGYTPEGSVG